MSIPDIFASHGEAAFRDGERRVIARLLGDGPKVLATGGGAYISPETRARVAASGISVWLKADHDTLMRRVRRRSHRPLLQTPDPDETMRRLIAERYPIYALADVTVESREGSQERVMREVVAGLARLMAREEQACLQVGGTGGRAEPVSGPRALRREGLRHRRRPRHPWMAQVARVAALGARAAATVTDATVAGLHAERLAASLSQRQA